MHKDLRVPTEVRNHSLLALSAVWLIIALVLSYLAGALLFPLETERTGGWLGWLKYSESLFNYRAFLIAFVLLVFGNALIYAFNRLWFSAAFELAWFLITALILEIVAPYFQSTETLTGVLGWNTVDMEVFDVPAFVAIVASSLVLNLWIRAEIINPLHLPRGKRRLHLLLVSLITVSFILYVAGLHMPIFHSTKFWVIEDEMTLLDTISAFWSKNEIFLGIVVLVFTIIFPLLKFIAVYWGLLAAPSRFSRAVNHWFSILGKWSMLDVFIVGLLLLNIKLHSEILDMQLRPGVIAFGISIIITMIVGTYAGRIVSKREPGEGTPPMAPTETGRHSHPSTGSG